MVSWLSFFTFLDGAALILLWLAWMASTWLIERRGTSRPSVMVLMTQYRKDWMLQMITRTPRIFDAAILSNLRQATTFFGSATMLALGGCLALIGNAEQLTGLARELTENSASETIIWRIKLIPVALLLANAFLRFVWSNRIFGYCALVMASVPNDTKDPDARPRALQAADLANSSARAFNQGIRSVYFALAATVWLLGPEALCVAVTVTTISILRREFSSRSRQTLLQRPGAAAMSHIDTQT